MMTSVQTMGKQRSTGLVILFSIITLGIYNLYWQYKVFQELKDQTGNGIGGGLALVIGIFIFVVNMFLLPDEIDKALTADGAESPVSALLGLWFLLPIIGWIVWIVKVQGALNGYWATKGAPAPGAA